MVCHASSITDALPSPYLAGFLTGHLQTLHWWVAASGGKELVFALELGQTVPLPLQVWEVLQESVIFVQTKDLILFLLPQMEMLYMALPSESQEQTGRFALRSQIVGWIESLVQFPVSEAVSATVPPIALRTDV